jgi:hypothetical protein
MREHCLRTASRSIELEKKPSQWPSDAPSPPQHIIAEIRLHSKEENNHPVQTDQYAAK